MKTRDLVIQIQSLSVEEATKVLNEFVKGKKEFVPPSIEEVVKFFADNGYTEEHAKKVYLYYEDAEPAWTDSAGKPIRGWKQKMRGNWMRNEGKTISLPQAKPSVLQQNRNIFT